MGHELLSKSDKTVTVQRLAIDESLLVLEVDVLEQPQVLERRQLDAPLFGLGEFLSLEPCSPPYL